MNQSFATVVIAVLATPRRRASKNEDDTLLGNAIPSVADLREAFTEKAKRRIETMSKLKIAGWVLSFLMVGFLVFASAAGKFTEWEGKEKMFEHIGYSAGVVQKIGIVEVVIAVLFLIPQGAFLGAILLTAYLGGATATHVRVGDPFIMPIIFGVLLWIALGLRDPRIFSMAFPVFTASKTH